MGMLIIYSVNVCRVFETMRLLREGSGWSWGKMPTEMPCGRVGKSVTIGWTVQETGDR